MESALLKPQTPSLYLILDLVPVSRAPRNITLINQAGVSCLTPAEVMGPVEPLHPQRKKKHFA